MVESELEGILELDLLCVVDDELVVLQGVSLGVVNASVHTRTKRDL